MEGPGIVNLNSTTANNSARRFLRTANGTYYLAYSTDGEIIFKRCGNNEWETIGYFEGRYPALSLDRDGITVHIVYSFNDNGEEKLLYRYFDANNLSAEVTLFATEGSNYFGIGAPSTAVRNDSLFIVWECGKNSGEINQGSSAPPTYEIEGVALLFGSTSILRPEELTAEEIGYKSYNEVEEIDIETLYNELVSASMDVSETSPYILWDTDGTEMRIYQKENGDWNYLSFLATSGPGYEPHVSIEGEQIFYLWVERIPGEIYYRYQYVGDNDFISKICNISITRNFDSRSPFYAGKYVFWSEEIDYESGRKYDIVYLSLFDKAQETTTFINWSNNSYTNSRFPQVIYHKEGGSYYSPELKIELDLLFMERKNQLQQI